jgi:dihydrofolate reductase
MRKLILKMSVSVDGFVAGPKGEADWIFRTGDDESARWTVDTLWRAGLHLMGSRTYYDMAAWWPTSTQVFAPPMNEIPKAVATTRTPRELFSTHGTTQAVKDAARANPTAESAAPTGDVVRSWSHPIVLAGDLRAEIAALKQQPGKDLLAHGGAGFARSLIKFDLVDEFHLLVHPVALGTGLSLFRDLPRPLDLQLVSSTAFPKGSVAHVYRARPA